jgi:general secretion pathway protein L
MLRDFVLWWARQLRSLLPRHLSAAVDRPDALLATVEASHLLLTVRRRGRETPIGRFAMTDEGAVSAKAALPRRPPQVVLRPGADLLLERPVDLPLAAERELDRVIGFEMDRLTPFAAAAAVWQAQVTRRDPAQRRLSVRLSLVPRRVLAAPLDWMARADLAPTWLEATAADGTPRRMPLSAQPLRRLGARITGAASIAVAVLTVAALVTPFVVQSLARGATDRAIEGLGPQVAKVESLRRQQASSFAGADALAAEHARVGDALQVLAALTDLMPDDTWLTDLSLHQGKLNVSGQSPAAARLIPALAADPTFRNPAFAAPVTRAPDGHADTFVIRAELAP